MLKKIYEEYIINKNKFIDIKEHMTFFKEKLNTIYDDFLIVKEGQLSDD